MSDDPASAEAFRWELEQAIERLKKTRDALTEERDELARISNKLLRERDEARRMWCEAEAVGNCLSVDDMYRRARTEAKRRGWDCFNDNKNA